jgi:murein DD-endopeptidase MepM/ murein hydrolase activator NlpD
LIDRCFHAKDRAIARVAAWVHHHPERLAAGVAAMALVATGTTLAVANLAPDESSIRTRPVVETVEPLPIRAQIEALARKTQELHRSTQSRSNDSAEAIFKRLGVSDAQALNFLRADPGFQKNVIGRLGRNLQAQTAQGASLIGLTARWVNADDTFGRWTLRKTDSGYASDMQTLPLVASTRLGSGTITSNLFAATDEAQIHDSVAVQLAEIFSGDVDFHRLHKGDRFSVVYEALLGDDEVLGFGKVLSAEFVSGDKTHQAVWFQQPADATGKGAYYTPQGDSLRRAFLISPLEFSRVTSGFSMRFHPILQTWRAHLGTDYAAATGTPARTVADGVVSFSGTQNGYGNVVFVQHAAGQTTVYAHLSRLLVRAGEKIRQGQSIGLTGATGWATGPHLHFEFRVNGVYQDPQKLASSAPGEPIQGALRATFMRQAASARAQLAAAALVSQASAQ